MKKCTSINCTQEIMENKDICPGCVVVQDTVKKRGYNIICSKCHVQLFDQSGESLYCTICRNKKIKSDIDLGDDPRPPEAKKDDTNKAKMCLLLKDFAPLIPEIVEILELGEKKYGRMNWIEPLKDPDMFTDAIHRHMNQYHSGNQEDDESGIHHLLHVAVTCLIQVYHDQNLQK